METTQPSITLAIGRGGATLRTITLAGESFTCGRAADAQILLEDSYVSTRHFRLQWDGEHYRFIDLGSSNGSMLNGVRVKEMLLREGDAIDVGESRLMVRRITGGPAAATPPVAEKPAAAVPQTPRTVQARDESEFFSDKVLGRMRNDIGSIRRQQAVLAERLKALAEGGERDRAEVAHEAVEGSLRSLEGALRNLEKDHRRLKALHAAAAMINRVTDLKGRLNAILDLSVEIMEADCGFLILYDQQSEKIDVALQRGIPIFDGSVAAMETLVATSPMPSFSIAREVLRTRKSAAITDLRHGSQFDASKSVMVQGLLAVLCAPMIFDDEMLGLIYVDFRDAAKFLERRIGPGDRELFEALGSLAATAIQNAKFFRNVQLEVERRTNLQRYLSPELVDQVVRQNRPVNLGASRRHASILFCDIRNFTAFAEATEPDRLIRQLNHFFASCFKAISTQSGSLDKYLGDGLMAFFGPLLDLENNEIAAVRAACQMQQAMAEANQTWQHDGWQSFQIGIGINAGEVVAGNLGSTERLEYTVIGDAVNVASRLSGAAKPGQILVTEAVAERLPADEFRVRSLEAIPLKGKSAKVLVFEVSG